MYASTACKSASLALEVTSRTKEMFTAKMLVNINDMQAYKPEAGWGVQKQKHGGANKGRQRKQNDPGRKMQTSNILHVETDSRLWPTLQDAPQS